MPLDENFPTYQFTRPNPKDPSSVTVSYTAYGSPEQQIYTITHSPAICNVYSANVSDARFPTITYSSVCCSLEFSPPSPGADQNALKALLPSVFTVNLFNPDSQVTVELKHSTMKGNYWEFSLPKQSFPPPTNSQIDAGYAPPVSERLYFRWRKEGGVLSRSQLQCYMISPANTPGVTSRNRKAGANEPDIPLAMYEGIGSKNGGGELVMYDSNYKRVDMEDLKGLELVLLLGARVINDVWFCPTSISFNTGSKALIGSGNKEKSKGSPPMSTPAMQPVSTQNIPRPQGATLAQRFQQQQYPQNMVQHQTHLQHPPLSNQSLSYPPEKTRTDPKPEQLRAKKEKERRKIEAEQEQIRRMLAQEEAIEKARNQVAIDAETQRLKRLYEQEAGNKRRGYKAPTFQNGVSVHRIIPQQRPTPVPQPNRIENTTPRIQLPPQHGQRPQTLQPFLKRTPQQPQRPAVVGGAGYLQPSGRLAQPVPAGGKTLNGSKSRTKSFLGLNLGGIVNESKKGKLSKKSSSMW